MEKKMRGKNDFEISKNFARNRNFISALLKIILLGHRNN